MRAVQHDAAPDRRLCGAGATYVGAAGYLRRVVGAEGPQHEQGIEMFRGDYRQRRWTRSVLARFALAFSPLVVAAVLGLTYHHTADDRFSTTTRDVIRSLSRRSGHRTLRAAA
jgi:hypothetical protein